MNKQKKEKLLLAVGERSLENFLKKRLSSEFEFTKEASYREIVIKRISEERPNVVLIREALKGSMSIENLVLDIREEFPEIRIVFYTSKSRPGEPLLRRLVSYGVYDFISGETVTESQIFDGLLNPKQLSDVRQFLDAPTFESNEPQMLVTSEYKDLRPQTNETNPIEAVPVVDTEPEIDSKTEDESGGRKGFFGNLFRRKSKDDAAEEEISEEETAENIEDKPEKEIIEEVEEVPPVKEVTPDKAVVPKRNQYNNPLGLFGFSQDESSAEEEQNLEDEPIIEDVVAQPIIEVEEVHDNDLDISSPMDDLYIEDDIGDLLGSVITSPIDESESVDEEDLFTNTSHSEPEPVFEPEPEPEPEPITERLVIEPRGKSVANNTSLQHRGMDDEILDNKEELIQMSEENNSQEIDFNPFDSITPKPSADIDLELGLGLSTDPKAKQSVEEKASKKAWFSGKNDENIKIKQNQVVTFISSVHGSGNTHVAFNTALKLADEGNRVLYIDLNSTFSSVDFSFQLGTWQQGIDKALEDVVYNSGMNVSDHILRMEKLKRERKKDKQLSALYKSLPDTLDYMFYSLDYQTLESQHVIPKERLRDLVMYIVTKERYDAIIIDSEPLGTNGVDGLLNLSNKIYITMTQDPGQMGVFHRQFDAVKERVQITGDVSIVVNKFVDVEPSIKRIQNWTNESVLQTIPFTHRSVVLSNFLGEPFILKTKDKESIHSFDSLARHIAD